MSDTATKIALNNLKAQQNTYRDIALTEKAESERLKKDKLIAEMSTSIEKMFECRYGPESLILLNLTLETHLCERNPISIRMSFHELMVASCALQVIVECPLTSTMKCDRSCSGVNGR